MYQNQHFIGALSFRILWLSLSGFLLIGCQPAVTARSDQVARVLTPTPAINPSQTPSSAATVVSPPTLTPVPTATSSPWPAASPTRPATATPTITLTPTPIGPCRERVPPDDLLTLVTRQYALGRDYEPADLVPLADYFPVTVTLGFPNEVRQVIIEPLQRIIHDMQAAGLAPTIISGYRSYASQVIAWIKWLDKEGDRGYNLSAPPGHSEHQLGTTVDFGSPELDNDFHTYFYLTGEGMWLAENAHKYGFSLSYPREAFELTGFYYEPWHYRYVGVELATQLKEMGMTLTEYQLITQPVPCIP